MERRREARSRLRRINARRSPGRRAGGLERPRVGPGTVPDGIAGTIDSWAHPGVAARSRRLSVHKNVLARPRRTKSTARTGPGLLAGATCDPRPARAAPRCGCSRLTISCQANTRPPKGTQGTPPGLPRPRGATRSRASEHPEKQQSSKASVFDADYFGELGKFCRTARAQTHARGTPYRRGKKTCNGIFSCWRLPVLVIFFVCPSFLFTRGPKPAGPPPPPA